MDLVSFSGILSSIVPAIFPYHTQQGVNMPSDAAHPDDIPGYYAVAETKKKKRRKKKGEDEDEGGAAADEAKEEEDEDDDDAADDADDKAILDAQSLRAPLPTKQDLTETLRRLTDFSLKKVLNPKIEAEFRELTSKTPPMDEFKTDLLLEHVIFYLCEEKHILSPELKMALHTVVDVIDESLHTPEEIEAFKARKDTAFTHLKDKSLSNFLHVLVNVIVTLIIHTTNSRKYSETNYTSIHHPLYNAWTQVLGDLKSIHSVIMQAAQNGLELTTNGNELYDLLETVYKRRRAALRAVTTQTIKLSNVQSQITTLQRKLQSIKDKEHAIEMQRELLETDVVRQENAAKNTQNVQLMASDAIKDLSMISQQQGWLQPLFDYKLEQGDSVSKLFASIKKESHKIFTPSTHKK